MPGWRANCFLKLLTNGPGGVPAKEAGGIPRMYESRQEKALQDDLTWCEVIG